jgi:hypothetical protein
MPRSPDSSRGFWCQNDYSPMLSVPLLLRPKHPDAILQSSTLREYEANKSAFGGGLLEQRWRKQRQHMPNLDFLLIVRRQINRGRTYGLVPICIYYMGVSEDPHPQEMFDVFRMMHQHAAIHAALAMPLKLPYSSCSSLTEVHSLDVVSKTTGILICNRVLRLLRSCCTSAYTSLRAKVTTIIHRHLTSQPTCPACSN